MNREFRTLVVPHINSTMHWQDLIDMAMNFDEARQHLTLPRNSDNYQRN